MLNLLDENRRELIDQPLADVMDHEEILSLVAGQEGAGQTAARRYLETTFPVVAPGEVFQVALCYLGDGERPATGKMICVRNVTSEKQAERTKHEFVAHLAHELKTPLTTINSYNEMLMDGEIDDIETQKQFYNTINEETDRLASLIESLFTMSKIEMGGLTIEKGLVKTDRLVTDCITAIEAPARKKRITINKNFPDKWPTLLGDKGLLKVALINVLGNAVKYSPEDRALTLSLSEEDRTVIFDIVDEGYGISQEDLPHIFEKFYRSADSHIKEQTGGGLGLAMTSEVVRLHGGCINVESVVGEGTHFSITLPREEYNLETQ
jgi:two-component system phosphate regulon sensor histidine kinase PhoR